MGTQSLIAIHTILGTVDTILCNWDGYLNHNGKILYEHYDRNKTEQLIELGDISTLGKEIGEKQNFENPTNKDWCLVYGRDRREEGITSISYNDKSEFIDEFVDYNEVKHIYLMELDGKWRYFNFKTNQFEMLETHLKKEKQNVS